MPEHLIDKQVIKERIQDKCNFIIYGAGMVGELVYRYLEIQGMADKVICFAVTHADAKNTMFDKPIVEIAELAEYADKAVVIIATFPKLHQEMQEVLKKYKFLNVIPVTSEMYEDMTAGYIEEFDKNVQLKRNQYDVLLMASDNNSSSGAFLCMAELAAQLAEENIYPLVVLPEYGNGEKVLQMRKVEYFYIPSKSWCVKINEPNQVKLDNELAQNRLEKLIGQYGIKVVHNNTSYTYVGALAARNKKIPVVWSLREYIKIQGCWFGDEKFAFHLINQSERIVAVSRYIIDSYGQFLNSGQTEIVYEGVDYVHYYKKREIFEELDSVSIIIVGLLAPFKGQEDIVKAAKILRDKGYFVKVRVVGDGDSEYVEHLKKLSEQYDLQKQIFFMGRQEKVEELYQQADIAVMSSRGDAFGRTTVEAQLAGCLVVGANAGATPEIVTDMETGMLYQLENADELAEKIEYAIENISQARKIAVNGQESAARNFTTVENTKKYIKIYRELGV